MLVIPQERRQSLKGLARFGFQCAGIDVLRCLPKLRLRRLSQFERQSGSDEGVGSRRIHVEPPGYSVKILII